MSQYPRRQEIRVRAVGKKPNKRTNTKKTIVVPMAHRNESAQAQKYMFMYKIDNGRRAVHLNNGVYNYGTAKCRDSFNAKGRCPRGKKCGFAHNTLEILFHPLSYKTRICLKPDCDQGQGCAWAHSNEELRIRNIILGRNWRLCDPIPPEESKDLRPKKANRRKSKKTGAWLESSETAGSESGSAMSVSHTYSERLTNLSVSMSPAPEEEEKKEEIVVKRECSRIDNMSEFERWFGNVFDCGDECKPYIGYLRRFEASGLDDISLLWDLCVEMNDKFVDLLVGEIGMDAATMKLLSNALEVYMCPQTVRGWIERVVGLPEYAEMFGKFGPGLDVFMHVLFNDDVLTEMGISSAGHRAKILMHFGRLEMEA